MAISVNSELTLMYWHIGELINKEVLHDQRAEYGKAIVSTLSTQLPWSAFLEVLPVDDALAREFYVTMAAAERWSVRKLRDQMDGMLYERTLISRKPEETIRAELSTVRQGGSISPELVFKSPYFLDFTGLKGYYSEKDLEDMIISGMQHFLMELGSGFSFVDRQKRMIIDGEDFYLDLLFYHRKLHRLVAIELKKTKFKAAYKGQKSRNTTRNCRIKTFSRPSCKSKLPKPSSGWRTKKKTSSLIFSDACELYQAIPAKL